jgi:hypothetical protein
LVSGNKSKGFFYLAMSSSAVGSSFTSFLSAFFSTFLSSFFSTFFSSFLGYSLATTFSTLAASKGLAQSLSVPQTYFHSLRLTTLSNHLVRFAKGVLNF